jgi:CheY-like chemotaxis protein
MPKILVVDDNLHLREILALMLHGSGYEILQAASGSEAVKIAISDKPTLILLDIDLPDMKGTDVARAIRSNSTSAHIPIIGCSAFLGCHSRGEALDAGMVDYLEKPISLALIKAKIDKVICADL